MKICIVFDNRSFRPGFVSGWGFSAFLEPPGILFDTGSETKALLDNFSLFNISLEKIHSIFLSHFHWDHTGGLLGMLPLLQTPRVFLHSGFSSGFMVEIKRLRGEPVIIDRPQEIAPDIFSTGPLAGPVPEAGLIIKIKRQLALLTGCAHPGILEMVKETKRIFGQSPFLVLGGFHLLRTSHKKALSLACALREEGVQLAAPSHCTGEKALQAFADIFQDGFLEIGAGKVLKLEELS